MKAKPDFKEKRVQWKKDHNISVPNHISQIEESSSLSDKSSSDDHDEDFSVKSKTTEQEILSSSSSDDHKAPSESSRVSKTKAKNVKKCKNQ